VIHARVEEDVFEQIFNWWSPGILSDAAIATPVIRHGSSTVRDDELQRGEIFEQIRLDQLHERGGVAVEVVGSGAVKVGVARHADVDHRRYVELDHPLVQRIPRFIRKRRPGPVPVGRIRIEIAADEAVFLDAPLELGDAVGGRDARRLRQLAHAHEIVGEQTAHSVDQLVDCGGPLAARFFVTIVVRHPAGGR